MHRAFRQLDSASVATTSAPLHLATCLFVWSLGSALGLAAPLSDYLVYVPLIYLISAAPVSLAGLGVQEFTFTAFFGAGEGLALALLFRVALIASTLPAPIFWPSDRPSPSGRGPG